MPTESVSIPTRDGTCPARLFRPDGTGPWPGVLLYMDGIGIRPAIHEIGEQLATHGYVVLVPDLYYRSGPYAPMNAKTVFSNPEERKVLGEKFMSAATVPNVMHDTRYYLDYLESRPDVRRGGVATTGYCMGGLMSLSAAGHYPDRIVAAASYHGGRLASDAPESPHRLAPKIRARVYVAGAIEDPSFPDDMKARLDAALTAAGVRHTIETYPAKHGFVPRDTLAADDAARARHWNTLTHLLSETFATAR